MLAKRLPYDDSYERIMAIIMCHDSFAGLPLLAYGSLEFCCI